MQDIKNKIEAVLFITGRFMGIEEIANFCSVGSVGVVKDALASLVQDYVARDGGLEILQEEGRYKLNIKRKYGALSTNLLSAAELDAATQATLAIIAYKQPAQQADIIKMRGNSAYDHIKVLKDMEFITSEKSGRTRALKLAPKFYDYFDVVEEQLQQKFKDVVEKQQTLAEEKNAEAVQEAAPQIEGPVVAPVQEPLQETAPKKKRKQTTTEEQPADTPEEKVVAVVQTQTLEVQRSSSERLRQLNADDFGS